METQAYKPQGIIRIAQLMLLVAIGISGYLAFKALLGTQIAGCGPGEGCEKVLSSKWASVLGIPISLPGMVIYLGLLATLQLKNLKEKQGQGMALTLGFSILIGAIWFTGLQMFLIKAYCPYCCTAHAIASLASLLVIYSIFKPSPVTTQKLASSHNKKHSGSKKQKARRAKHKNETSSSQDQPSEESNPIFAPITPKSSPRVPLILSLLMVGSTIALQIFGPTADRSQILSAPSLDSKGEKIALKDQLLLSPYRISEKAPLQIAFNGGSQLIESGVLQQLTLGTPSPGTTPTLLTYIFDWTCDHCRAFHQMLTSLSKQKKPLDLEGEYIINILPGSYESSAETLHRVMFTLQKHEPDLFNELEAQLYDGSLPAEHPLVLEKIIAKLGADQWASLVSKSSYHAQKAIDLGRDQAAHNESKVGISLFPQLTSSQSVISGIPTEKSLKSFLVKASQEQEVLLKNPPLDLSPPLLSAPPISTPSHMRPPPVSRPQPSHVNAPKRNKSKIQFESIDVKTDPIIIGETAVGTFHFTNTGSEPLEIYKLKTGCGCTYSQGWQQIVQPGQKGSFSVNYNSKGKSPYGTHIRHIWVTSSASNFDEDKPLANRYGNQVRLLVPIKNADGSPAVAPKKSNTPSKIISLPPASLPPPPSPATAASAPKSY